MKRIYICIGLIKKSFKVFFDYWRFTKSIDFMIRITFLWFLIIVKILFPKVEKFYTIMANRLKKDFIFNTTFGKFIGSTENQWFVMQNNYEPDLQKIIINNTKKNIKKHNNVFINIWSHIWRWAIELAKNYNYNIIAFEPAPNTYYTLRCNVVLSNLEIKIKTYNMWLWNKDWNLKFEYFKQHDWWSHIITDDSRYTGLWEIIDIPVKKLDTSKLISNSELDNTRLIMIDVEWYELDVLKWMKESLKKLKDIDIIVEIFENNKNKNETIRLMTDLWYKAKQIDRMDWLFSK